MFQGAAVATTEAGMILRMLGLSTLVGILASCSEPPREPLKPNTIIPDITMPEDEVKVDKAQLTKKLKSAVELEIRVRPVLYKFDELLIKVKGKEAARILDPIAIKRTQATQLLLGEDIRITFLFAKESKAPAEKIQGRVLMKNLVELRFEPEVRGVGPHLLVYLKDRRFHDKLVVRINETLGKPFAGCSETWPDSAK